MTVPWGQLLDYEDASLSSVGVTLPRKLRMTTAKYVKASPAATGHQINAMRSPFAGAAEL